MSTDIAIEPRITAKPSEKIRAGDIVWDGEAGFTVSTARTFFSEGRSMVELFGTEGDFWMIPSRASITVAADAEALNSLKVLVDAAREQEEIYGEGEY